MVAIVAYGGADLAQISLEAPLGVCEAYLHSEQSFRDGKILRMGHYAKILQLRFRLVLRVS